MMGYGMGMMGGGGFFMIIWILIIIGAIYFFNNNRISNSDYRKGNDNGEKNAVTIARKRYAKGEINKEELNEILSELR